jgi:hypothetical protein
VSEAPISYGQEKTKLGAVTDHEFVKPHPPTPVDETAFLP